LSSPGERSGAPQPDFAGAGANNLARRRSCSRRRASSLPGIRSSSTWKR
jgi:hypothetical protein